MDKNIENFTGNFYPDQYNKDSKLEINHNYLLEQFADHDDILQK